MRLKQFIFAIIFTISVSSVYGQWTTTGNSSTTTNNIGIGVTTPMARLNLGSTATIGLSNLSNASLLVGTTENGIGIDPNELVVKGNDLYFGTITASRDIFFLSGGSSKRMVIDGTTGNVGIGSTAPATKLQVNGKISITKANNVNVHNIEPNVNVNGAERTLRFNHNSVVSTEGFEFYNQNKSKSLVFIQASGKVGIGTTDPKNELSVNGTIWAKKIRIKLTDAADWVFEDDYNLRPLTEVENYIKTHKHLPEIPSAEEFRANDMEVSEMTNKLLQKIEELTLYTIEQEKQLEAQNKELKKVKKLENEVKAQNEKLAEMDVLKERLAKLEALLVK